MHAMKVKHFCAWMLVILLAGMACRAVTELPYTLVSPGAATSAAPVTLQATRTAQPSITQTPVPVFTPSLLPSQTAPARPALGSEAGFQVRVHPDGGLTPGDQVSFEVIAPAGQNLDESLLEIALPGQEPFARSGFGRFGLGGRVQATLTWAWDTSHLAPGDYPLQFTVRPEGFTWTETVTLLPLEAFPANLIHADWAEAHSDCCTVYYITGTAAERDLDSLLLDMDAQAQDAAERIGVDFSTPITVTLLPRLLGHGGFASDEIHVSYLDRNYAGEETGLVLHHEMIHVLDGLLGGELRPTMLVEGLAVYLSGGHFKPEPLMPRAAALLDTWGSPPRAGLGWYIALTTLADSFYAAQHEIGYLQAGALVEYMVQTWGWPAFNRFYRAIPPDPSYSQAQALDAALQTHFNLSLAELERRFIQALRRLPADTSLKTDVRLTIQFYDSVRRYQQAFDPSAYFLSAWLVNTAEMRQRGIVADYLRHPFALSNGVLEALLADTAENLQDGRYSVAEQEIGAVNAVLDAVEAGWPDPFSASLVAADFAAAAQAVAQNPNWVGAQPAAQITLQRLWIDADQARIWVSLENTSLVEVLLQRDAHGDWQLLRAGQQVTQ